MVHRRHNNSKIVQFASQSETPGAQRPASCAPNRAPLEPEHMFIVLLFLSLSANFAVADECQPRLRAILDVGSGSTKLNLSEVDVCPDGVHLRRTLDDQTSLDVPLEANKDQDGNIKESGVQQLLTALKKLKEVSFQKAKEEAPNLHEIEFAAVGTHAFRTAKNQATIAQQVAALGIPMVALTQKQEAQAGFEGVQAKGVPICAGKKLLVWDVGGGSMEWTLLSHDKNHSLVTGLPLGAESFKSKLITKLKLERPTKCAQTPSPNPIGQSNGKRALAMAVKEAQALPNSLRDLKSEEICMVGIGGVHTKAVEAHIDQNWNAIKSCVCGTSQCRHPPHGYTLREVECLANYLAEKTDCDSEIKGPYSTTSVSNLFLIHGFLKELNIREVHTENVNMGHGLAVDRKQIRFQSQPIGSNSRG